MIQKQFHVGIHVGTFIIYVNNDLTNSLKIKYTYIYMYNLFSESTLLYAFISASLCGFVIYVNDKMDELQAMVFEKYIYLKTNLENLNSTYILPLLKGIGFGKEDTLVFIKDGKEILKTKTEKYESIKDGNNDNFDLIFRCVPNEDLDDEQEYDVKICKNLSEIEDDLMISNISFLSPKLQINYTEDENEFEECFEFDNLFMYNNLYIENNELFCYEFIQWFLLKNKEFAVKPEDKLKITFIDHNMNLVELSNGETIIIEKDSYVIKNKEDADKENEEKERKLMSQEDELSRENKKQTENTEGNYNFWIF